MPDDITAEFANADLKDVRRSRRLDKVVAAWTKAPAASIAAGSGGLSGSSFPNCQSHAGTQRKQD
jgi:hypothetical protein